MRNIFIRTYSAEAKIPINYIKSVDFFKKEKYDAETLDLSA